MKRKEQINREANEDSEGSEESKRGLDRYSVRRDQTCLHKNNSNRAYQLEKDLTSEKQSTSSTIQGRSGKCVTEEKEILSRWTEYCSYYTSMGVVVTMQFWTAVSPQKKI